MAAKRLASDLNRAGKCAAKWQKKDAANQRRRDEWLSRRTAAMTRIKELMATLSMPPHERFALITLEQGGDAELIRIYPKSTRCQRDQWRSRAYKLILAYDPSLKPWMRLRRTPDFSTPRRPSVSIALIQSATPLQEKI
jgi:hypothetical protein